MLNAKTNDEAENCEQLEQAIKAGWRDVQFAGFTSRYGYWKKGDVIGRRENSPQWEKVDSIASAAIPPESLGAGASVV